MHDQPFFSPVLYNNVNLLRVRCSSFFSLLQLHNLICVTTLILWNFVYRIHIKLVGWHSIFDVDTWDCVLVSKKLNFSIIISLVEIFPWPQSGRLNGWWNTLPGRARIWLPEVWSGKDHWFFSEYLRYWLIQWKFHWFNFREYISLDFIKKYLQISSFYIIRVHLGLSQKIICALIRSGASHLERGYALLCNCVYVMWCVACNKLVGWLPCVVVLLPV